MTSMRLPIPTSLLFLALVVSAGAQPSIPNRGEIRVTPLDINETADDFAPAVIRGGDMLYFTSARSGPFGSEGSQRIWMSTSTPSGWSTPATSSESIARAKHVGGATLTPDGNFMIFGAYKWSGGDDAMGGLGRTDLYSAEKVRGEWINISNLGPTVNGSSWDSQPSLSPDGRTLYFASDRGGGEGGTDIYVSVLTPSGWTPALNVGPPVNTPGNEMSPTIAPDGRHLFFASDGHGGVGGFDLFAASVAAEGKWGDLENLGTPINTIYDEYYFVSVPNSKNSYFCSGRSGNQDIYLAYPNPFPPEAQVTVSGRVLDAVSKMPIAASVQVTDLGSGEVVANYRTDDRNGDYYVLLTKGHQYSVTAEAPGFIFYSNEYEVPENTKGRDLRKDIILTRASGGLTRLLVFFDYDKSDLKKESIPDLRRAVDFLKRNPSLGAELAGHTDSVGSEEYNLALSQARASEVMKYIQSAGIAADRLRARGYGESKPVADNGTDDGRAANRRVEMVIIQPGEPAESSPRR